MSQTEIRLPEQAQRFSTVLGLRRSISGCSGEIPLRPKDCHLVDVEAGCSSPEIQGGDGVFAPVLSRRPLPGGCE